MVIHQRISNVLGTTDVIGDVAAIRFAEVFYGPLCNGEGYDGAYGLALNQLKAEKMLSGFPASFHILRKTRIVTPTLNDIIRPELNLVEGIAGDDFTEIVYLATGGKDKRYWPSRDGKLTPDGNNKWSGHVNAGKSQPEATINLIAVDESVAEYIEFYRTSAKHLKWSGIVLDKSPHTILDSLTVRIDLMPLRDRLLGRYAEFTQETKPTGMIVEVELAGEWGITMACTKDGKPEWKSTIMMDDSDPNVGKGVYAYPSGQAGHHHIRFLPAEDSILVDGYILPAKGGETGRKWANTNLLRRIS
jgi:hypothetical protein